MGVPTCEAAACLTRRGVLPRGWKDEGPDARRCCGLGGLTSPLVGASPSPAPSLWGEGGGDNIDEQHWDICFGSLRYHIQNAQKKNTIILAHVFSSKTTYGLDRFLSSPSEFVHLSCPSDARPDSENIALPSFRVEPHLCGRPTRATAGLPATNPSEGSDKAVPVPAEGVDFAKNICAHFHDRFREDKRKQVISP